MTLTVPIITDDDGRRPDHPGPYSVVSYHDDGTVTITVPETVETLRAEVAELRRALTERQIITDADLTAARASLRDPEPAPVKPTRDGR